MTLSASLAFAASLFLQFGSGQPPAPPADPPVTVAELQKMTGGPTLINFTGQNVYYGELTRLFAPQAPLLVESGLLSGLPARAGEKIQTHIDVDWKQTPVLTALKQAEQLTGLKWYPQNLEAGLVTTQEQGMSQRFSQVVGSNPFVQIGWNGEPSPTFLTLAVLTDPKIYVVRTQFNITETWQQGRRVEPATLNLFRNEDIALPAHLAAGSKIELIKGMAYVTIATRLAFWRVADMEHPTSNTFEVDGYQARFFDVRWSGTNLQFSQGLRPLNVGAESVPARFDLNGRRTVRDSKGNRYGGWVVPLFVGALPGEMGFHYAYAPSKWDVHSQFAPPISFEWYFPMEVKTLQVPFEIHDVVIPAHASVHFSTSTETEAFLNGTAEF